MTVCPDATGTTGRRLTYRPELDGLRALAVVLVLLFHQGFAWMPGGYVGVSVFFTLSGYLITSLLLVEQTRTSRIAVGEFYARRVRRLLPAALLCIVGVLVGAGAGIFPPADDLGRALLGAVAQVANWEALTRGGSYASLLGGGATPVDHFWSLAVEEQFYWCWPLVMVVVCRRITSPRRRAAVIVSMAIAAVVSAPVVAAVWGPDAAYWSTPARLGEILSGAALAAAMAAGGWRRRGVWRPMRVGVASSGSALCLAAIAATAVLLPSDRGPAYAGLLPAWSLVSVVLIGGLGIPGTWPARVLSVRPLVVLGRISYGVYLYHWPVFLALWPGNSSVAVFVARLTVTLSLAALSYVLVERPVRRHVRMLPTLAVGGAALVGVLAAVILVAPSLRLRFDAGDTAAAAASISPAEGTLESLRPTGSTGATPTSSGVAGSLGSSPSSDDRLFPLGTVPVPSRPVRVLVLGDSTGVALGAGLISWAVDHPDMMQVTSLAAIGCGLIRDAWELPPDDVIRRQCEKVLDVDLPALLADAPPDVVVIHVSLVDAMPRTWDEDEGQIQPDDPRYARRLEADYVSFAEYLLEAAPLRILWTTPAEPAEWFLGRYQTDLPSTWWDPQRRTIALLDEFDRIDVVDLGGWIVRHEVDGSRTYREDGLHLSESGSRLLAEEAFADGVIVAALGLLEPAP